MTSNLYNIEDLKSDIEINKEKISEEKVNIKTYDNQIKEIKASGWSRSTLRQKAIGVTGTNLLSESNSPLKKLSSFLYY